MFEKLHRRKIGDSPDDLSSTDAKSLKTNTRP